MPDLTPDQMQKIRELVHKRRTIDAIKEYRITTGVGLAEAKDAVTAIFHNDPLGSPPPVQQTTTNDPYLDSQIRGLLSKRKKIEAVKVYREARQTGLKDAKDMVDRIEVSMRREDASVAGPAANNDPFAEDSAGNWLRLLIVIAAVLLILGGLAVYFIMRGV